MKNSVRWILALVLLGGLSHQSYCLTYVSDSQNYSISLGEKWGYINQSSLRQAESDVYARTGQMNRYAVGFKLKGSNDFEYPYILVQDHERQSVSMKELEELLQTEDVGTGLLSKYPGYADVLDNVSFDKPYADKERGIVYMTLSSDMANIGNIAALMGLVFGRKSIAGVYCYALGSNFNLYYKEFVGIIESCAFEPSLQYGSLTKVISESVVTRKSGWLSEIGLKAIGGLIAGGLFGLVAFVAFILTWIFRKKPKPHSYGKIDYATITLEDLDRRLMGIKNINEANNLGISAIMSASASTTDLEKIKLLLDKGADVNQMSKEGMTAFLFACGFNENLEIVRLIRSRVSNIDQASNKGRTALSLAAECNSNTEVVDYLIMEGADINSADRSHRTPLIWACATGEHEDNIMLLINRGAKLDSKDSSGYIAYKHLKGNDKLKHSEALEVLKEKTGAWL